jgi:AGCS family alanine or glycine:cation symporter
MRKILFLTLLPFLSFADGIDQKIDAAFAPISNFFSNLVFFTIYDIPFVLMLLVFSALFFTIYFAFPNIRYFKLAINTVRGKYDDIEIKTKNNDDIKETIKDESQDGEVSHFQALATAVSGTVGNGNIAGVALAIALGGPGATFWMIICGLLGMSTKFVECTLGVQYRDVDENGTVYGGPMYYISKGLKKEVLKFLEKLLLFYLLYFVLEALLGVEMLHNQIKQQ